MGLASDITSWWRDISKNTLSPRSENKIKIKIKNTPTACFRLLRAMATQRAVRSTLRMMKRWWKRDETKSTQNSICGVILPREWVVRPQKTSTKKPKMKVWLLLKKKRKVLPQGDLKSNWCEKWSCYNHQLGLVKKIFVCVYVLSLCQEI